MPATLFVSVLIIRPPPRPTLFPYTTLFRSLRNRDRALIERLKLKRAKRPVPDEGSCVLEQARDGVDRLRSEEHTSELQSLRHLVCRLLLEKKNGTTTLHTAYARKHSRSQP